MAGSKGSQISWHVFWTFPRSVDKLDENSDRAQLYSKSETLSKSDDITLIDVTTLARCDVIFSS